MHEVDTLTEESAARLAAVVDLWRLGDPVRVGTTGRGTNNWVVLAELADGRRVVIRGYHNLDAAQVTAEHDLLAALGEADLPFSVPRPLPTPDGRTWVAMPGPVAVFAWLPGERPDPTGQALRRVGRALGLLDRALARVDRSSSPHDWRRDLAATHPAVPGLDAFVAEFGDTADLTGLADLDETYAHLLGQVPVQVVHQDLGLSNVLLRDGEVTALLDFELAGVDVRVADVVATLVQSGCTEDVPGDPLGRATALLGGYGEVLRLDEVEVAALPALVRFRAAGSAMWRYGRYLRGHSDRAEVVDRLDELAATDAWVREHGDALVTLARRWCGG